MKNDLIKNNNQKANTVGKKLDGNAPFHEYKKILTNGQGEIKALPVVCVFVASIPNERLTDNACDGVYPIERAKEIKECGSQKVKREKYYVWKLLSFAIENTLGKKITELTFTKCQNGKWACDGVEFSLSHCKDLVGVAISSLPVGVDVELIARPKSGVVEKYLNDAELTKLQTLEEKAVTEFLISTWSAKESLFKLSNDSAFCPSKYNSLSNLVKRMKVSFNNEDYIVTVASECSLSDIAYYNLLK